MANIAQLDIDNTAFLIGGDTSFIDDTLTFAGAATYDRGMILARNTSTGKLVAYVSGGATGTGTPVTVLTDAVTAAGAGDEAVRVPNRAKVRADYLLVLADLPTVGVTDHVVLDSLADYGIASVFSDDRSFFDNAV